MKSFYLCSHKETSQDTDSDKPYISPLLHSSYCNSKSMEPRTGERRTADVQAMQKVLLTFQHAALQVILPLLQQPVCLFQFAHSHVIPPQLPLHLLTALPCFPKSSSTSSKLRLQRSLRKGLQDGRYMGQHNKSMCVRTLSVRLRTINNLFIYFHDILNLQNRLKSKKVRLHNETNVTA